MSLNEARRIAKRLRKQGVPAGIMENSEACKRANPGRHPMSGASVVYNRETQEILVAL